MNNLVSLATHHGYLLVFLIVLAEAIGLPAPAALALIAGGAAAAAHALNPVLVAALAAAALLIGDSLLFILGRYSGWALLGLLCKLSANPESCILRSAESFYKRGRITLLVAKFIPGINTMAAPLAGSMRMPPLQFLRLDAVGSLLYVFAYGGLGFLFRDFVAVFTRGLEAASHAAEIVFLAALAGYAAYRIWMYSRHRDDRLVPRVQVEELARELASAEPGRVVIVDVRSHGYYDAQAARIKGSIRIEPNNLDEEVTHLSPERDIYLYCT